MKTISGGSLCLLNPIARLSKASNRRALSFLKNRYIQPMPTIFYFYPTFILRNLSSDIRNFNFHLHVHAGRAFCGSYVRRNVKKTQILFSGFRNFNFHLHVHAGRAFCGSSVRRNVKKTQIFWHFWKFQFFIYLSMPAGPSAEALSGESLKGLRNFLTFWKFYFQSLESLI